MFGGKAESDNGHNMTKDYYRKQSEREQTYVIISYQSAYLYENAQHYNSIGHSIQGKWYVEIVSFS